MHLPGINPVIAFPLPHHLMSDVLDYLTPSLVFADVKRRRGPRSGGRGVLFPFSGKQNRRPV